MISEHNQSIEQLDAILRDYSHSEKVRAEIGRKSIVMFSGPFAIGKTTLMQSIEKMDDNFSRTRSFTTRPCRSFSEQENYRFMPHTEDSIQEILGKATAGELVQGMVHPTTRYVYGSELRDYGDGSTALLDIVPKAVKSIEKLPFRESSIIEVVTSPDIWRARVASRGDQHDDADRFARVKEAKHNLEWALSRRDILWVDNSGAIQDVITAVLETIDGNDTASHRARALGEALLRQVNTSYLLYNT